MVKVASTSKSGSSSKGLAGFAALINSASLSAARKETNQGLRRSGTPQNGLVVQVPSPRREEWYEFCFHPYAKNSSHSLF
jgi:hypothetical protein